MFTDAMSPVSNSVESASSSIGKRYQLQEQLGSGGMGAVFRAFDRLTGQSVALKRVYANTQDLIFMSRKSATNLKIALAKEFRALASLRHPNIIGVLDYGFDIEGQPYFTMDLVPKPLTIRDAAFGQKREVQIQLLTQMLQALAYLHRRGVVHRDLKPGNVLVSGEQVKIVDFGLSVAADKSAEIAGTLAYMAPEILNGEPAHITSDLYGIGLIAHEIFVGRLPFEYEDTQKFIEDVLHTVPDFSNVDLDADLVAILARLLAKKPADRYAAVEEVIKALAEAVELPVLPETEATRESFLQAAPLIGREDDLERLTEALDYANEKRGSTWLIAGESGVGKSRLMEELRTLSLVKGALVLRGQAIREGGSPYQVWRDAIRRLVIATDLRDSEASAFKAIVPDMATLLERAIEDAPTLDPQAAQNRLFSALLEVIKRQHQLMVILLEDLHWAGQESRDLFDALTRLVNFQVDLNDYPLLVVGTFRDDEGWIPTLPETNILKLKRLSSESIAALSEAMLGPAGRREDLVDLLYRETDGNAFFLVETVRALAAEAGRLDEIANIELPKHIVSGGVSLIVHRRLSRVSSGDRLLLQLAAAIGRQLNLDVLETIEPSADLESWLGRCTETSIIEFNEGRWRFVHENLREVLLADISSTDRPSIHRRIALALEKIYGNADEQVAILAYHWNMAGEPERERRYTVRAGEQAMRGGAYQEARSYFERTLAIEFPSTSDPVGISTRRAYIQRQIGEASYSIGNTPDAVSYFQQALASLGYPVPGTPVGQMFLLLWQFSRQIYHRLRFPRIKMLSQRLSSDKREVFIESALCGQRLALIYYLKANVLLGFLMVFFGLNQAEAGGSLPEMAHLYSFACVAVSLIPLHSLANYYSRRTRDTAQMANDLLTMASVLRAVGLNGIATCQWRQVQDSVERSVQMYRQLGDQVSWGESISIWGLSLHYHGKFADSIRAFEQIEQRGGDTANTEHLGWGLQGVALGLLRQDKSDEALRLLAESSERIPSDSIDVAMVVHLGVYTRAYLQDGDLDRARHYADKTIALLLQSTRHSVLSMEGFAGAADLYIELWEKSLEDTNIPVSEREKLRQTVHQIGDKFGSYVRTYPMWGPRVLLARGRIEWLDGRKDRSFKTWREALLGAQKNKMSYEEGLAHYEIGYHLDTDDPTRIEQLMASCEILEGLGATYDLRKAKTALTGMETTYIEFTD